MRTLYKRRMTRCLTRQNFLNLPQDLSVLVSVSVALACSVSRSLSLSPPSPFLSVCVSFIVMPFRARSVCHCPLTVSTSLTLPL